MDLTKLSDSTPDKVGLTDQRVIKGGSVRSKLEIEILVLHSMCLDASRFSFAPKEWLSSKASVRGTPRASPQCGGDPRFG